MNILFNNFPVGKQGDYQIIYYFLLKVFQKIQIVTYIDETLIFSKGCKNLIINVEKK
ncbi:unnamed protein product [Paramecium sonneborni]|uniref:Uncharacterized protein n=1 Tax=Paramecium sonneborni TaxID=65129 RepID=A0A8S1PU09_9CILI|nr:unnamed protein product [Paramecium sonneborni]